MARGPTLHIQLDKDLRARLAQIAKKEHRSLNNLVGWLLMEHPLIRGKKTKSEVNGQHHKTDESVIST